MLGVGLVYTLFCSGDETGGETPVLIPNTAVKTSRGDGTALCGRVARRQYKVVCCMLHNR